MQGYSINGYLNAVRRRTTKTVLVEGATDSSVLVRLKRSIGVTTGQEPSGNIDVTGLLTDEALKGLGKRDVLRTVLAAASTLAQKSPDVEKKFGTLQDREWDNLDLSAQIDSCWTSPFQNEPHFTTTGHSIENYFFKLEFVEAFLLYSHSDDLDQYFFNSLQNRFKRIIALATVYSIGLKNISAITKSGSLLNRQCIVWNGSDYQLTENLSILLSQRNVSVPSQFVSSLNAKISSSQTSSNLPDPARWLCHGHLGEDAIWACIGHLAFEHTGKDELAQAVERGNRDAKFKHAVDKLSNEVHEDVDPLRRVINWLTSI